MPMANPTEHTLAGVSGQYFGFDPCTQVQAKHVTKVQEASYFSSQQFRFWGVIKHYRKKEESNFQSSVLKSLQQCSITNYTSSQNKKKISSLLTVKIPFQTYSRMHLVATYAFALPKGSSDGHRATQNTMHIEGAVQRQAKSIQSHQINGNKNKTSERCFHRVPLIPVNLSSRANKVTQHSTSQALLSKIQLTRPAGKNFLPFLSLHCSHASNQKLFKI